MSVTSAKPQRSLAAYLSLLRFEHTLFALPFAYGGMLLAAGGWPGWRTFLLVSLAMVGARTAAMAANRVIDARSDALNPRTAGREIPSGRLTRLDGLALAALGTAALALAGALLNWLTLALLPVALVFLILYPYTKRFTWACHLWLGLTIGAAAAGGYIAVSGSFAPTAWALWLGVAGWVAGFDIVYALADTAFDRQHGLHSIPARFGAAGALLVTGLLYAIAAAALLAAGALTGAPAGSAPLAWPYQAAIGVTVAVLAVQLWSVARSGTRSALGSFNANLVVGPLMLVGIVAGMALR